ncbi:MAG TPA: glycosyltransferase, partial [Mucilaginibacter sp.]
MKSFSTTLLISTYNWPAALNLLLKSLLAQTRLPDEIVIADDGSG